MWKLTCLLLLVWVGRAVAQEMVPPSRQRWFPETQLAPLADWHRPDLAARRVQAMTRTFISREAWQLLGDSHGLEVEGRPCRETLTYDTAGYLQRYYFELQPAAGPAEWLQNEFSYAAGHRLTGVQVHGSPALQTVADEYTGKSYLTWRQLANFYVQPESLLFRQAHGLPTEQLAAVPTLQLHELRCRYNAQGQPLPALAAVELRMGELAWADTLPLDVRRGWRLAVLDSLAGQVDTAWLHSPRAWVRPAVRPVAGATTGLRAQQRHPLPNNRVDAHNNDYRDIVSIFGSDGQLRLTRDQICVYQYAGSPASQPTRFDIWLMHGPPGRDDPAAYFGSGTIYQAIPDCEGRQRLPVLLPDGRTLLAERQYHQTLRFGPLTAATGLPRRAVVEASAARYRTDVNFQFEAASYSTEGGRWYRLSEWRNISARNRRANRYLKRGCVPMTTRYEPPRVIVLTYVRFPQP